MQPTNQSREGIKPYCKKFGHCNILTQFDAQLEVNGRLDFKINRMKKLQTVMAEEGTFRNLCQEQLLPDRCGFCNMSHISPCPTVGKPPAYHSGQTPSIPQPISGTLALNHCRLLPSWLLGALNSLFIHSEFTEKRRGGKKSTHMLQPSGLVMQGEDRKAESKMSRAVMGLSSSARI